MDDKNFQKPILTSHSRNQSKCTAKKPLAKSKKTEDSPYLAKLFSKNIGKPILNINRKFQLQRSTDKLQNTLSNFERPKFQDNKFYQTISNGFIKNERPLSKQQSRSRMGNSDIFNKNVCQLTVSDVGDLQNQSSDLGKLTDKVSFVKEDRPQTSKGDRAKVRMDQKGQNMNKRRKQSQQNICDQNEPQRQRKNHPHSAMQRVRTSDFGDLIKINTRPIDQKLKKVSTKSQFTNLIDNDFLSLFANSD